MGSAARGKLTRCGSSSRSTQGWHRCRAGRPLAAIDTARACWPPASPCSARLAGIARASRQSEALPRWTKRVGDGKPWWHPALTGASESLQLTGRNWRSPGRRTVGIQRVDAATAAPVSVRNAFITLALQRDQAQAYRQRLDQPANARAQARRLAANDEIERMRASRPDEDPTQLMIDAAEVRHRHGASTCTWMLPRMLARTAVDMAPLLWSGRRQTVTERLAGTGRPRALAARSQPLGGDARQDPPADQPAARCANGAAERTMAS